MKLGFFVVVLMLLGLYLVKPVLSPWAERVMQKELQGWIGIWMVTTLFYLFFDYGVCFSVILLLALYHICGEESSWNNFGLLHYLSGFVGYTLLALWLR